MAAGFPDPAIYHISESGGDARIPGAYSGKAIIRGNTLTDNFEGIVVWENSDRHCADGSDGPCTLVDPSAFTLQSCANVAQPAHRGAGKRSTGSPPAELLRAVAAGSLQNVAVTGNTFSFTPANIPKCTAANLCGFMGMFSNYAEGFAPYMDAAIPTAITFNQNNSWSGNTYSGPWSFWAWAQSNIDNPIPIAKWQAAVTDKCTTSGEVQSGTCDTGFGQDQGSTRL